MKSNALALVSGALFGVGLAVSGMTQPTKVIGFLDILGDWDPALAFVMGGAVLVYAAGFALVRRRGRPLLADQFHLPTRQELDPRLLGGAALFGIGWGLGGFCPGPALTSLASALPGVLAFTGSMLAGMVLWTFLQPRTR